MRCNLPRSWDRLPQREKDAIENEFNKQLNYLINKEEAELQDIWIKLACMVLHDTYGFGEERLLRFIAKWDRVYRRNDRIPTKSKQTEWLNAEMKKCFPRTGFPQARIDHLKEKGGAE